MQGTVVLGTSVSKQLVAPVFSVPDRIENEVDNLVMASSGHVTKDPVRAPAAGVDRGVIVFSAEEAERRGGEPHLMKASLATICQMTELHRKLERPAGYETARPEKCRRFLGEEVGLGLTPKTRGGMG